MERWNSQIFRNNAVGVPPELVVHMTAVGKRITSYNREVQPVFTLKHLAVLSGVDYGFLRHTVGRDTNAYTEFRIRKRSSVHGQTHYRTICVPSPSLMKVQRWIARNILSHVPAHPCSVAFSTGDSLYKAVAPHCPSKWLVKLDIRSFFESINEISVYHVFKQLGFESLIAFEMARLCTHVGAEPSHEPDMGYDSHVLPERIIKLYQHPRQGHLPQGAPTSPMLANLVCRSLDERLSTIADEHSVRYTRYADDMTFSSNEVDFGRERAGRLIKLVYQQLNRQALRPNTAKTTVVSPGARKLVLGLSVEEDVPRLTRQFKESLRQHIYYLLHDDIGPAKHAATRKFASTIGLRNHIEGLLAFASQIEPTWAALQISRFQTVSWPH
ncbi:RNA-directed DNA polymerase [Salmonella enterica subsp. enterica serovar Glostrup]|nr:RNA-directed DNA polymerase [Salmonella enterica]EDQ7105583.1 RNA-directed DNA polymerase [Salmonella enterica subsp. enterica serovar Glostrup]EDV0467296.1 RNA-directed DNA polymerase [Salmonella enterica subsp. enterica serovar Saintpaul]EAN8257676.1 RNA-directed DNA polymerase [Salmonella enterica]EAT5020110.1 RNA-directed DNA polymerase [Salmonella enterica]